MADQSKGLGDAVASLAAAITSPAKLAFVAYVILAASPSRTHEVSLYQFFIVTALFLVVQIWHDDYLRAVLNYAADLKGRKAHAEACRRGALNAPAEVMERLARIEAELARCSPVEPLGGKA